MNDLDVSPTLAQILGDQAAVAAIRFRLAAEQDRGPVEQAPVERVLDTTLLHQPQELRLVILPASLTLLVVVQNGLSGREPRLMHVSGATDFLEKEARVLLLVEARQLRDVVQPDIDQPPDARLLQTAEEFSGVFLGKTDRVDFHSSTSGGPNSASCARSGCSASSSARSSSSA